MGLSKVYEQTTGLESFDYADKCNVDLKPTSKCLLSVDSRKLHKKYHNDREELGDAINVDCCRCLTENCTE